MKRRKKYKVKKKSLGLLLILLIVVGLMYLFIFRDTFKDKLKKIGYNEQEIKLIYDKKVDKEIILGYEYIDKIADILNNKNYIGENLSKYIDLYKEDRNIDSIIYIVNNSIKYDYSEKLNNLINSKYFILENLDRYMKYDKETNEDLIIRNINSNLDLEFYTDSTLTDTSKGTSLIVNKYYGLEKDYHYGDLVTLSSEYSVKNNQKLSSVAYEAFKKLVKAGEKDGVYVRNLSAYRGYKNQEWLYNNYKSSNGLTWADKWSARPGYSEHQTGLALDVCSKGTYTFSKFEKSEEFKWMKDNSYKYGFILRYPAGKTNITGYGYEPWHYRYVGVDIATYIYENDITYEEYYAYFVK